MPIRKRIYVIVGICIAAIILLLICSDIETSNQIESCEGNLEFIVNNSAVNPTWNELESFLMKDNTNSIKYVDNDFTCTNFAQTLKNNSEEAGIKAAYVYIEFSSCKHAHACNAFNTTDKGLVFIDCTGTINGTGEDRIVTIEKGMAYCPRNIYSNQLIGCLNDSCTCIVKDFKITW